MSTDNPTQDAESVATLRSTCDVCAEGDKLIVNVDPETEAYICEDCWAYHQRSIAAAAKALSRLPVSLLVADGWAYTMADLAAVAVKAYLEFTDEPEHSDGTDNG